MPHADGEVLEGSGVLLLGVAAFAVVILSAGIAYGALALRSHFRRRAAKNKEHILEPPPRLAPSVSETLELGNAFRKRGSRDDPFVLLPHNLASYLPSTPPRAYLAGASPATPPGLPPCKDANSAMVPIIVITNTPRLHQSVEVQLENAESRVSAQHGMLQVGLPVDRALQPIPEHTGFQEDMLPTPRLEQISEEIPDEDALCSEGEETRLTEAVTVDTQDFAASTPLEPIYPTQSSTARPLSPRKTPFLPTLVLTSASMQRGWIAENNRAGGSTLPSPPNTPTLVLTSPSIHCGLDADPDERLVRWTEELQSWSDILELEEYEDEVKALLGASFSRAPRQLQTPPRSPIFLQTAPFRPRVRPSPASADEQHPLVSQPDEDAHARAQTEADPDALAFDYAAFRTRLASFNLTHQRAEAEEIRMVDEQPTKSSTASSSSSQSAVFDYDKLRARKRAGTVSARSRPLHTPPLAIQFPAPARCAAKPRPMPLSRPGYI